MKAENHERFVIRVGAKYVALDQSSGGYPYLVDDLFKAELWTDATKAINYVRTVKSMLSNPRLVRATLKTEPLW